MSILQKIREAMSPFSSIIVYNRYDGPEEDYIVYNFADDIGADHGDSRPTTTVVYLMIHHYLPANFNFLELKKKEREALFKAGFTYPEFTVITEKDYTHLIYECEIECPEEVDNLGNY